MTDTDYNAPYRPAVHRPMAAALCELLARAEDGEEALPLIYQWQLQGSDPRYNNEPVLSGLMHAVGRSPAAVRAAASTWAKRFGGSVVEVPNETFLEVYARFEVGGASVVVWDAARPDSKCPVCGGPAVGDLVLKHGEDCRAKAEAEAAAAAAQPVTAAVACGKAGRWAVLYDQGGVPKRLPVAGRTEARRWIAEHVTRTAAVTV